MVAGKGIFTSHTSLQARHVSAAFRTNAMYVLAYSCSSHPNSPSPTSNKILLLPPLGEAVSCCNCALALFTPSFTPTSPKSTASVSSTPPTVVATAKRPAKAEMLKLPDPEDHQPGDEQCRIEKSSKIPSKWQATRHLDTPKKIHQTFHCRPMACRRHRCLI